MKTTDDIRTQNLPNGFTLIRHMASGLTALANTDGTYRHGTRNVWRLWTLKGN